MTKCEELQRIPEVCNSEFVKTPDALLLRLIASGDMTNRLHHVLATEKRVKGEAQDRRTGALRLFQTPALFEGQNRTYRPKEADGDTLPPQDDPVQYKVKDVLTDLVGSWVEKIDTNGEKCEGNTHARASVEVSGQVILEDIPSTQLLFLEKELDDLRTLVQAAPVLGQDIRWKFNPDTGLHESPEIIQNRDAKEIKPVVLSPATDKHPANVTPVNATVVIGTYSTVKFSGAITPMEKRGLLDRIRILQGAVKRARETANTVDTEPVEHGKVVLDFVFDAIV
jgi:hypothetical protein